MSDQELSPEQISELMSSAQGTNQKREFIEGLPHLSENDIVTAGHKDSVCPVCLIPLLAIIAEEEMALAMDSPAHPPEELGVTKLDKSCGHIFCRRDIQRWVNDSHQSCPMCRTPFLPTGLGNDEGSITWDESVITLFLGLDPARHQVRENINRDGFQASNTRDDDTHEFTGMYS